MNEKKLSLSQLLNLASQYASNKLILPSQALFGASDGKAVGTYVEQGLRDYITAQGFSAGNGSSANGLDFPDLNIDLKVTSLRQPQSSCPFKFAKQKVYGLGYSLLVFVYNKVDIQAEEKSWLDIQHIVHVASEKTADYQLTKSLIEMLSADGNRDDVFALLSEKNLPLDEIGLNQLADEIMQSPPVQGYLTISNALQWRLQYTRIIEKAGVVEGINSVYRGNSK
ncbi:MAG: restriction endonuclease [Brachymonas sp.]|nr:restriction endonuclease [Brachymonas sp.]NJS36912.1 restriction endonuclease [Brachymonas sp.]